MLKQLFWPIILAPVLKLTTTKATMPPLCTNNTFYLHDNLFESKILTQQTLKFLSCSSLMGSGPPINWIKDEKRFGPFRETTLTPQIKQHLRWFKYFFSFLSLKVKGILTKKLYLLSGGGFRFLMLPPQEGFPTPVRKSGFVQINHSPCLRSRAASQSSSMFKESTYAGLTWK